MPEPVLTSDPLSSALIHPLDEFYRRSGLALPRLETVPAARVPQPYHQLLVHSRDMTSTLEKFHQGRIHVVVQSREERREAYFREVILVVEPQEKAVEFGAIKINLELFTPEARQLILKERWPLGRILNDLGISYISKPKAFLRLKADRLISGLLSITGSAWLFGRRNQLLNPSGQPLAEIVEILPPEEN